MVLGYIFCSSWLVDCGVQLWALHFISLHTWPFLGYHLFRSSIENETLSCCCISYNCYGMIYPPKSQTFQYYIQFVNLFVFCFGMNSVGNWIFKHLGIYLNKIDGRVLCRYGVFSLTLVSTMPLELPLDLHLNGGRLWLIICCLISVIGNVEQLSSWFLMFK